jgi:hypothetical protein
LGKWWPWTLWCRPPGVDTNSHHWNWCCLNWCCFAHSGLCKSSAIRIASTFTFLWCRKQHSNVVGCSLQ